MGLDINGESSKNIWPSYFTPSEKEGLVNHLPDEILIKIFNYILQENSSENLTSLNLVCKRWQNVYHQIQRYETIQFMIKLTPFFINNFSSSLQKNQIEKIEDFNNQFYDLSKKTTSTQALYQQAILIFKNDLSELLKEVPTQALYSLRFEIASLREYFSHDLECEAATQIVNMVAFQVFKKKVEIAQISNNQEAANSHLENAFFFAISNGELLDCLQVIQYIADDKKKLLFNYLSNEILAIEEYEMVILDLFSKKETYFSNEKEFATFQQAFSASLSFKDVEKAINYAQAISITAIKDEALLQIGYTLIAKDDIEMAWSLIPIIESVEKKQALIQAIEAKQLEII